MPFIQENKIEINIGLKNEYKLIHFSDVHAVTYNDTDSDDIKNEALKAEETWYVQRVWFADKFNEHHDESHMIPSKNCLRNIIKYINEEKPLAAILTGDIIDYYSLSNYDMLKEELGNLNYPFLFACGNHETPVSRYEDLTFDESGFNVLEFNEFKIISLDNSTKKVTKDTLNKLKDELESTLPVVVAMHIPISTTYNKDVLNKFDSYFLIDEDNTDETTKEFIDILKNDNKVKAILCGHVHGLCESYFAPNKKEYCASSGLIGLVNKVIVK